MKTINFSNFANIKKIIFTLVFILMVYYTVVSIKIIFEWFENTHIYKQEYNLLKKQKDEMEKEIHSLQIKVAGLTSETIDKNLLEERAKKELNMIKSDEIVIVN